MNSIKAVAEAGYVMGLQTIGEVVSHVYCHYDAYFLLDHFAEQSEAFDMMTEAHLDKSIDEFITAEDKARIDKEMQETFQKDIEANLIGGNSAKGDEDE